MKKPFNLLILCILGLLAACAAGPHTLVLNEAVNFGAELGPEMRNRNMIAIVALNEEAPAAYKRVQHNILYTQGVQEGTPEYRMRVVPLNMAQLKGALWYGEGSFEWSTAAMVPDHVERLKWGDLVEFRQPTGRLANKDFSRTGEGNVVLRVLCHYADADYKKCKEALPQVGKGPGGDTHTPYPASAREYRYVFTPAWDDAGKPVRAIPEYRTKN